jgi:hypothetical protein
MGATKGVKLSHKAMAAVEARLERDAKWPKYDMLIQSAHLRHLRSGAKATGNAHGSGLRRFPRRIYPYGAGCLVSGKEEQKAHSNAM